MAQLEHETAAPGLPSTVAWPARRRGRFAVGIVAPATLLGLIVLACLVGPPLVGLPDPNAQDLAAARQGVGSPGHLLGTDALGRDVLTRALHGGRISLLVGVLSVALGLVVGGAFGLVAGYRGRRTDMVLSRVVDVLLAFPALVLVLAIATYLGPSVQNVILAIAFFTTTMYFRLARAGAIALRDREFVIAARLAGARSGYTLARHIAPLVAQPLLAYSLLAVGAVITVESGLSFLGLGVRPPQATWGVMIADGKPELTIAAHMTFVPAVFLFLTVVALNMLGDALRARADRNTGAG